MSEPIDINPSELPDFMQDRIADAGSATPPVEPAERDPDLPKDCPVQAIGFSGEMCFFLDAAGQFRQVKSSAVIRELTGLFIGSNDKLWALWPRYGKEGAVNGVDRQRATDDLVDACANKGMFEPLNAQRGRGAWRGANGELIFHRGSTLEIYGADGLTRLKPGRFGRHVYPREAEGPAPSAEPQLCGRDGPGAELLSVFKTWNWNRGTIDATLALGWVAAAMLGGALEWRPSAWVTGGRGAGKSTFLSAVGHLLDGGVIEVADATAAGIWQTIGLRSEPVMVDELESASDNRKQEAIITLMRIAVSGGKILGGSSDHTQREFQARSAFLFSSINVLPLSAADKSRLAILELGPVGTAEKPDLSPGRLRELGARIRRRLVDGWERIPGSIASFRQALLAEGHDQRGADQFGTLLALSDVVLNDQMPDSDSCAKLAMKLAPSQLLEIDDETPDERNCLDHVLTHQLRLYSNAPAQMVATYIREALNGSVELADQNGILEPFGIKVVEDPDHGHVVAFSNTANGLANIFKDSPWQRSPGKSAVWPNALRRLPGAFAAKHPIRIGGVKARATLVPVSICVDLETVKECTPDADGDLL